MPLDLQTLPKVRDSWSHLYVEHAKIDQDGKAIAFHDADGMVPVPCASLTLLLLGPGTSISHAAIRTLAENGCMVGWTGEESVRFYASGSGETRSARNLMHQARVWAHPTTRLAVVFRMYRHRFNEELAPDLTLRQLRGWEGVRVREAYARASRATGVEWHGRQVNRSDWGAQDPINKALSSANACLYGVCHAAIVAAGYSPGMGFIHTGKMLSFVYDIADLYKADFAIPAAFDATAAGTEDLESRVRKACRDAFRRGRLLARIVDDIQRLLDIPAAPDLGAFDDDAALPGGLWDPVDGIVQGGVNWAAAWEQSGAATPLATRGDTGIAEASRPDAAGSPAQAAPADEAALDGGFDAVEDGGPGDGPGGDGPGGDQPTDSPRPEPTRPGTPGQDDDTSDGGAA